MQNERIEKLLAEIQADPKTLEFLASAIAQATDLLSNPPLQGEVMDFAGGAEYQRISPDVINILEKNGFISLLLVMANFITNIFKYMYFGYAQPDENEEEEVSRGKLRAALLVAIVENEYVVTEYFKLVFNTNNRYPEWRVFPDSETREEQIRSAQLILEVWQALIFPEGRYPQNTMFSQGQQDFLQAQFWDMQESENFSSDQRFAEIRVPEVRERMLFLAYLLEHNQCLPKPDLDEARMLYSEILLKAKALTKSANE